MVARHFGCDRNRLKLLLEDRLPGDGQAELEEHLDTCAACRDALETLAADAPWWSDVRTLLDSAREAGATDTLSVNQAADGAALEASPLDFLERSDNPAALGRLGNYDVLQVVGRGGMGLVLKGFDPNLNRWVAIKVLAPHLATSAAARQRFAREARAAAAVVHEHVVAIHSVDTAGRLPYLVMPYVGGPSLQSRLDQTGAQACNEVLRIGLQVAEGLAAAHAQGLVHRDVKPANILLENNVERVKITDFGLARAVDDATLTHSGFIAGTPQYMSPEQAKGEATDHRSDLFSLGSVLYAMCTGRPPFRAETTLGVLRRICEDRPRPVRELNPEIPQWLCDVVDRLHAKDPAERFQSAAEVASLLAQYLAHRQRPTSVPMPPKVKSPRVAARRRRTVILALASVAVSVTWFGTWLLYHPAAIDESGPGQAQTASKQIHADGSVSAGTRLPESVVSGWDAYQAEVNQLDAQLREAEIRWLAPAPVAAFPDPLPEIRARLDALEQSLDGEIP